MSVVLLVGAAWLLTMVVVGCFALALGRAAAGGDELGQGASGSAFVDRRTGPADRRAGDRPLVNSPGRRRDDLLRAELAEARERVAEAETRLAEAERETEPGAA